MWFNFSESSLDLFFRRIRIVATAITEIEQEKPQL